VAGRGCRGFIGGNFSSPRRQRPCRVAKLVFQDAWASRFNSFGSTAYFTRDPRPAACSRGIKERDFLPRRQIGKYGMRSPRGVSSPKTHGLDIWPPIPRCGSRAEGSVRNDQNLFNRHAKTPARKNMMPTSPCSEKVKSEVPPNIDDQPQDRQASNTSAVGQCLAALWFGH